VTLCIVTKRYIIQQMCLNKWIGNNLVTTHFYYFCSPTPGFDSQPLHYRAVYIIGQVVRTDVPLFTKQYNVVPCEGFHVNAPVCGSHSWAHEQGEYCSCGSAALNHNINYLLYFLYLAYTLRLWLFETAI